MEQEITCEKCDGRNIKKDGVRETKNISENLFNLGKNFKEHLSKYRG